jgi:hypothetical protein
LRIDSKMLCRSRIQETGWDRMNGERRRGGSPSLV